MATKKSDFKENIRSLESSGFYSDYEKNGILYATLVRSPAATGKIKSVTIPELPQGYYFYTADDIPGIKKIQINKTEINLFGYGSVSYNGEPLAILAGPDEKVLNELADKVSVTFDIESLESALKKAVKQRKRPVLELDSTERRVAPDSNFTEFLNQINEMPSLDTVLDNTHNEQNTSVTLFERQVKTGLYETLSPEEADNLLFTGKKYVSNESWSYTLGNPKWHETNGAFCHTEGEKLHVYTPTKWTYFLQKTISEVLNIPLQNIYIHKTKNTGVFQDGLWRTTQLATQVALASFLSRKPVKLIFTQHEQKHFIAPGTNTLISYKTAVNEQGLIETLNVVIDVDVGCANPFAKEITDRLAIASCGYYKPQNLFIHVKTHTSKNPPTSISLNGVDSQAIFAIENQLHTISQISNIFPDEIRKMNAEPLKNQKFPFDIHFKNYIETIDNTLKIADFNRKYASFRMDAIDRVGNDSTPFFALPLRGVGLSTGFNTSAYWGSDSLTQDVQLSVTLTSEEKVIIHAIKPSEVVQEIWKKTASEIFQLPKQNISIDSTYELKDIPVIPENIFSTIGIMNELLKKCCLDIQKKRFHQPLPLSSKRGITPTMKKNWNTETFTGSPYNTTSFACTAVEVELDPYTYSERIKSIYVTVCCGELFDEVAARKTIRLEIQQQLTMLVQGKTVPCSNIVINFIPSDEKAGQIGGLIHNTLPSAFSSALSLALDTQLTHLPCTESQLFELIKERERHIKQKKNPQKQDQSTAAVSVEGEQK